MSIAIVASPTWAEAEAMDPLWREALRIVKGEQAGDKYVWEGDWEDEDGVMHIGGWLSDLKKRGLVEESEDPEEDGLR